MSLLLYSRAVFHKRSPSARDPARRVRNIQTKKSGGGWQPRPRLAVGSFGHGHGSKTLSSIKSKMGLVKIVFISNSPKIHIEGSVRLMVPWCCTVAPLAVQLKKPRQTSNRFEQNQSRTEASLGDKCCFSYGSSTVL